MRKITKPWLYLMLANHLAICSGFEDIAGIQRHFITPMISKEGDVNIGIQIDMTAYDAPNKQCLSVPQRSGCKMIQMANYVVNEINNRTDLLPNITVGFVAIDGCFNDMKTLEVSTYVLQNEPTCSGTGGQNLSKSGEIFSDVLKNRRVVGLVITGTSRIATALVPLMGVYGIPVIGTYASSDALSDKSIYQYYARLIAADNIQVLGVLGVARYFGWSYVSVVYAEGAYGENAVKQLNDHLQGDASDYGICIAMTLKISSSAGPQDYDNIADQLLENKNARVVFNFVENSFIFYPLFNSLHARITDDTFVWVSADAIADWEFYPIIDDNMTEGMLFIEHTSVAMPDFLAYLNTVTPLVSTGNDWILKLWETTYECSFSDNTCSSTFTLDQDICPVMESMDNRIHDGFVVIAQALNQLIQTQCPQAFQNKSILRECIRGDALLQIIMTRTATGVLGKIKFTDTGDYLENLLIKQYVTVDDRRQSRVVGVLDTSTHVLKIDESQIRWSMFYRNQTSDESNKPPVSVCSKSCLTGQYIVPQAVACCWLCEDCRSNEIVTPNLTSCEQCPIFTWPDDTSTVCIPIEPYYLSYTNIISVLLLCMAAIFGIVVIICISIFIVKRQTKLVKALSFQLSMIILTGELLACIDIVLQVVPPDATPWICDVRRIWFHMSICIIYTPLLVKNIRMYRIFAAGKKSVRKPRFISTEAQVGFTAIFLLVQVILTTSSQVSATASSKMRMPSLYEKNVELYCNQSMTWFLIPLSYNIVLMLLCACIGFVTRKLPNNFNESWFIFISVSTTLFSWVVFIPAYYTVPQLYMQSAILGFTLSLICIVTLICQYVPVLYALLFVPKEKVIVTNNTSIGKENIVVPVARNSVSPS